jgi:UDP-N-acetylglucosamine 2-epimerase
MKIVSVVGARPQFIKLFPVSRALRLRHQEIIVHTGQHYDFEMSEVFLRELEIPRPDYNLEVGSGSHAKQTARMLTGLEDILLHERPDIVLVFGDTNSTLAGALAAAKLRIRVAHVEAGLRSFNREMPEEVNRVVTDHLSDLLLCPTQTAVRNLAREGITAGVHCVGDVMFDAALHFGERADARVSILSALELRRGGYLLATIHRASNTDSPQALGALLAAFAAIEEPVAFPIHPRTRHALQSANLTPSPNVRVMSPVGYLEMLALEKNARMVLTDSGGVQKEAYFFGVPCVTLRTETEWTELVDAGWNCVVGLDITRILAVVREWRPEGPRPLLFGQGDSSQHIAGMIDNMAEGRCV